MEPYEITQNHESGLTVALYQDFDPTSPADWDEPSEEDWELFRNGDVWGYVVMDGAGAHLDSCWGFYGYDYAQQEAREALESTAAHLATSGTYAI